MLSPLIKDRYYINFIGNNTLQTSTFEFFFFFFLFLQEQYVPSSKNLIGERKCHTSVIQTPNGKDIAQSLTVSTFVLVCLCLLMLE